MNHREVKEKLAIAICARKGWEYDPLSTEDQESETAVAWGEAEFAFQTLLEIGAISDGITE